MHYPAFPDLNDYVTFAFMSLCTYSMLYVATVLENCVA